MRRLWILTAALVALGGFAAFAPAAGAASTPSPKFCTAINKIGDTSSKTPSGSQAKTAAKQFKAAAKFAPAKVKSAMNTIASYLSKIGSIKNPTDLAKIYTSDGFKSYSKAIITYVGAATECSATGS
jgi:hypothetical protein